MNGTSHQFCVRWNSHLGSLGAAFPELLAGQYFVDVTLACEGHQLHCHRLVLASCSSYFNSLLRENPCRHPIVILPRDIKLWAIQALVDFMYKGEVNVSQIGLGELLKSAEILQIRGLCGSDANAIFNLNQVPNSNGTDMTMNNNESLQVSSSQLINNNGNGATSTNEQNNSANNDISQQYEALSAYPNRNGISVTNSNNLSQNSQRNSIPSTSGNQFSNTNISKPIRIQRMTTNGFDSANDELNLSLSSQSEENNDNDCVSFNKIIEPKEEPIDENMDDDNMNGDGDMNPDSESGRQDDNSDAGRRSTDYSRLLEIVHHHQNQTKQQQQEQNKRTQNLNKNNNKLQKNQNQLIYNDFHKIICRPQYKKNSPNPTNNVTVVSDEILKNVDIIKSRNTSRLNGKKKVSGTDRNNVLSDKIKRTRLDYRKINDGNESDSSNASLIIIEKKQTIIEISDDDNDDDNEENCTSNNLNNNNNINNITCKVNNKKPKANMADDDDNVNIGNGYDDDDDEILLRETSNKISKGHINQSNEKFYRSVRVNTDDNKKTRTIVQRQLQQQQEHDAILSFDENYKLAFPSRSQSSNSSKSTETRNKTLSLKFDSQSMSISVMNPSIQETDLSNDYSNSITNNASSAESKSVLSISAKEKASFRQEIRTYLRRSTISNHFDAVETENENENEIEINNSNFENIVCAPNVNDFCSNDDNSGFILMSNNHNDNDNDINLENESLATIYFDEEFYNLCRKPQPSPTQQQQQQTQLITLDKNQYSLIPFSSNTNTNTKIPLKLNLSSSLDTSNETGNACNSLFLKENPPPEAVVLRNPRGNQPRSYSNEALYSALMDVKRGASIYRASQKHNVPRKTLRNWMKRWDIKSAYPMPTQLKQAAEKKKLKKQQNDEKFK